MTSKIDEIRRLLSSYYAGETSIEDERALIAMMKSCSDMPEDLAADRDIILAIEKSRGEMPSSLPGKLDAMIAGLECKERGRRSRRANIAVAATAAIVLIAGIGCLIKIASHNPYEVTDPKIAFNETRRALLLVSDGLNSTDEFLDEANSTLSGIGLSLYETDEEDELTEEDELNQGEI
ncbi:MAG: hypothetical protein HDS41_04060 [Bacteroides sp.]|nr:hypothetical protein [Bacteroides sp.]